MARGLTTAVKNEFLAARLYPILLFEGEFSSGWLRMWSGVGTLSWNGYSWLGAGKLGAISPIGETADVRAEGVTCSLSGIPSDLLATALGEVRTGKPASIYFGCVNDAGTVIADPYLAFAGRIDLTQVQEGSETSSIHLQIESELIDLQRARLRRYTNEEQQADFAGDRGLEYIEALQDFSGEWGAGGRTMPVGTPAGARPRSVRDEQRKMA